LIAQTSIDLTVDDKQHLSKQIISGLLGIHDKSIVHRDIKPSNIMITRCNFTFIDCLVLNYSTFFFFVAIVDNRIEYHAYIGDFGLAAFGHENSGIDYSQ